MAIDWNAAAAIGQWLGALATFLAVYVALKSTKDARDNYNLEQRPYLAFDNLEVAIFEKQNTLLLPVTSGSVCAMQIGVTFRNVGKTISSYYVDLFDVEIDGNKAKGEIISAGGIVYPGMQQTFRHAAVPVNLSKSVFGGQIKYEIRYKCTTKNIEYFSAKELSFNVFFDASTKNISWKYLIRNEVEETRNKDKTKWDTIHRITKL